MNLNQLRMFVTVVEKRGFSSAARHLNISPTAVSKQIKSLEDHLGVQFILRSSTLFEITDVGDQFYLHCKRILKDMDNLENIVHCFQNEPSGKLTVFSTIAFAETYMTPHIKEFMSSYPKIQVNLDIADRIPDVQREDIDLCFGLIGHWDEDLIQKKLTKTRTGIYASPSYLESHEIPKSRKDLLNHTFICHSNRPNSLEVLFKNGEIVPITPCISVNDQTALLSFAKDGLGLIVLFDFIAQPLVDSGQLTQILTHEEMLTETYYVFYPPAHHILPASRVFLDFVLSKIK